MVINLVGNAADAMDNNGVLSVVHGIVTAHDGAMVVTSTPGEGTSFELFFPCVDLPAMTRVEDQDEVRTAGPAEAERVGG